MNTDKGKLSLNIVQTN